jgi:hypothetical protein
VRLYRSLFFAFMGHHRVLQWIFIKLEKCYSIA